MKKYPIIILAFFLFNVQVMAQSEEKSYKNKNIIEKIKTIKKRSYFNYEKGFHRFIGAPTFGFLDSNIPGFEQRILGLGCELGYGLFPVNHLNVSLSTSFIHFDNSPYNDATSVEQKLVTTYYFLPKKRVSIILGIDVSVFMWTYTPSPDYLGYVFYNDIPDNKRKTHFIPMIALFSGISIKVGKRFTMPVKLGYRHSFRPSGRPADPRFVYMNYGIYYNFRSLKRPKDLIEY